MTLSHHSPQALPTTQRMTGHLELRTGSGALLGDTRVRLLEMIERHGSISQAAKRVPLSYKAAWDAVEAMNRLSDRPLVLRVTGGKSGGGTQLTDHGRRLVALYRAVQAEQQIALDRLSQCLASLPGGDVQAVQRLMRGLALRTSARNQFNGTVCGLREGPVDFEVQVQVDEGLAIAAVVTRGSALALGLRLGSAVVALVKSSSLLLFTDPALRLGARNQLWGTVTRLVDDKVNCEVTLDLDAGRQATAVLSREIADGLDLQVGVRACAAFKVSSVVLVALD